MKRLNQTESPIFVIFICSLFPKAILFDFYANKEHKDSNMVCICTSVQSLNFTLLFYKFALSSGIQCLLRNGMTSHVTSLLQSSYKQKPPNIVHTSAY